MFKKVDTHRKTIINKHTTFSTTSTIGEENDSFIKSIFLRA